MRAQKLNFTIPEDIAAELKARVSKRKRSAFVSEAVHQRLKELEESQLRQALVEGYQARREEGSQLGEEWETATLESWD